MTGKKAILSRSGIALVVVLVLGLLAPNGGATAAPGSPNVAPESDGNAVVRWNRTAADAALNACLAPTNNPLHESRMYAMMHIAIHDALNAIKHRSRPYAFKGHAHHASPEAAVASAARTTLVNALSELTPPFSDCSADSGAIAAVEADYTTALAAIPDGPAKVSGISLGRQSAYTILANRATDGSDTPLFAADFPQGDDPGEYRFTPGFTFAFAPKWGKVDPFILRKANQFRIDPPYALDSKKYADDFNEVKELGGDDVTTPSARSVEETQIARFWVESSPLLWNRIARQVATDRDVNLWQSARLFGLLNIAMSDGYIATFANKYDLLFWRPVTAIQLAGTDGNEATVADPTWTPLVPTPPIPDHDSGHSVEGGAASAVLRGFFRTDHVEFSTCSYTLPEGDRCTDASPVVRHFTSFSDAAKENARSRVLVGFHFTHATKVGTRHGVKIGNLTVRRALQPGHR